MNNAARRLERLERRALPAVTGEECEECAALRRSISRVYGEPVEPFKGCTPAKCGPMHRNISRVYGGDNGDGLKAAA